MVRAHAHSDPLPPVGDVAASAQAPAVRPTSVFHFCLRPVPVRTQHQPGRFDVGRATANCCLCMVCALTEARLVVLAWCPGLCRLWSSARRLDALSGSSAGTFGRCGVWWPPVAFPTCTAGLRIDQSSCGAPRLGHLGDRQVRVGAGVIGFGRRRSHHLLQLHMPPGPGIASSNTCGHPAYPPRSYPWTYPKRTQTTAMTTMQCGGTIDRSASTPGLAEQDPSSCRCAPHRIGRLESHWVEGGDGWMQDS